MCFKITVMGSSFFLSSKPPAETQKSIRILLHLESRYYKKITKEVDECTKCTEDVNWRRSNTGLLSDIPHPSALCSCCFSFFFFCLFGCFFRNTSPAYTHFQSMKISSPCHEYSRGNKVNIYHLVYLSLFTHTDKHTYIQIRLQRKFHKTFSRQLSHKFWQNQINMRRTSAAITL